MTRRVESLAETVARKTSRRGFFGRGADLFFVTMIAAATGALTRRRSARADGEACDPLNPWGVCTTCEPPGPECYCEYCTPGGVCAKPCLVNTTWYASGCWVSSGVTCCDCTCPAGPHGFQLCGCSTDFHANAQNCPKWSAAA